MPDARREKAAVTPAYFSGLQPLEPRVMLSTAVPDPSPASAAVIVGPIISITGNGLPIGADPIEADGTHFGRYQLGWEGETHRFFVTNTGGQTLQITSVTIPAGFELVEPLATTLEPGEFDAFEVRFLAAEVGQFDGVIEFETPGADRSMRIAAEVVDQPIPRLEVVGSGVRILDGSWTTRFSDGTDFGGVEQGDVGPEHDFIITNTGTASLTVSGFSLAMVGGGDALSAFELLDGLETPLAPGESDAIRFRLKSDIPGEKLVGVSINTNQIGTSNWRISGTVWPTGPDLAVSWQGQPIGDDDPVQPFQDRSDFGSLPEGEPPLTRAYTLSNPGGQPLHIRSVTLPEGFSLAAPAPQVIEGGGSATLTVQLDNATQGTKTGTIFIDSDATGPDRNLYCFGVTGRVAAPRSASILVEGGGVEIPAGAAIPLVENLTEFGTLEQDDPPIERVFRVTNDGDQTLFFGEVTVPEGFDLVHGLVSALEPGEWDTIVVVLDTAYIGVKDGDVSFSTNLVYPATFRFRIRGKVIPEVTPTVLVKQGDEVITHASMADADGTRFGVWIQGDPAPTRVFTVVNTSAGAQRFGGVFVPSHFVLVEPLDEVLPAGGSDTFTVALNTSFPSPVAFGFVGFATEVPGQNPFYFGVSGSTSPPVIAEVTGGESGAAVQNGGEATDPANGTDFGGVSMTDGRVVHTFTLHNTGLADFYLHNRIPIWITGEAGEDFFLLNYPPRTVPVGGSVEFHIGFQPLRFGDYAATVSVRGEDDRRLFEFTIRGEGVATFGTVGGRRVKTTVPDAQGVPVTLSLAGAGTGTVSQGPEGLEVDLEETTSASALTIATPRGTETRLARLSADEAIKSMTARTTDLVGEATLSGGAASITFDDWTDARLVLGGATADPPATLKMDVVAGGSVESVRAIKSITAAEWLDAGGAEDRIAAPSIAGLIIKGDPTRGLRGDFEADVVTTDMAVDFRKLIVAGLVKGATVRTAGNLSKVTAGALQDSRLFAGVTSDALPDDAGDFTGAALGAVTIKGLAGFAQASFANSSLAAASIGAVKLRDVDESEGGGADFGLAARTIRSLHRLDEAGIVKLSNLDTPGDADSDPNDDFVIRIV